MRSLPLSQMHVVPAIALRSNVFNPDPWPTRTYLALVRVSPPPSVAVLTTTCTLCRRSSVSVYYAPFDLRIFLLQHPKVDTPVPARDRSAGAQHMLRRHFLVARSVARPGMHSQWSRAETA